MGSGGGREEGRKVEYAAQDRKDFYLEAKKKQFLPT